MNASRGGSSRRRSDRLSSQTTSNDAGSAITLPLTPRKRKVEVDDEELEEVVKFVKKNRPNVITLGEKYDILLLQAKLRNEHLHKLRVLSPGRKSTKCRATERVSTYLHRQKELVGGIWSDFWNSERIVEARQRGNYSQKSTRVPGARCVVNSVQAFVQDRCITRTRTVAKDVMDFLDQIGFIEVNCSDKKSVNAALRSVQRFLKNLGYKRGKKKGTMCYRMKQENIQKRDAYVLRMVGENASGTRRIVYMDESYIHKNYQRHDDSLFDPNDEQDLETKAQHKGKRYCFIAAIIDADKRRPALPDEIKPECQKAQVMLETLDIFEGGKKQTADYHGMFDTTYFVKWMEKLLEGLNNRGIKNAIIVMDNAKYHCSLPEGTPSGSWKKASLKQACEAYGIVYGVNDTKPMLWASLKTYIKANVKPIVCQMAEDAGHEVLFSPPHHSDLQPIEIVWAILKGEVGRQYTTDTSFRQVLERLRTSFNNLKSRTVQGCINKANEHLESLWKGIQKLDELEEDEEDGGDVVVNDSEDSDTDGEHPSELALH
jgi:hypothetical protein